MLEIKDDSFENEVLKSNKLTVVDFWAEWCGPCKMMGPVFEEASKELPEVKFVKVNVDVSPQTASSFGIMSIPTVLFFKNGEKLDQIVGLVPKERLIEIIKKHL